MDIKVTNINGTYHARLYDDSGAVLDEMSCEDRRDIGWICREMLRWQCKLGSQDPHAKNARVRHNEDAKPIGKIKYLRRSE